MTAEIDLHLHTTASDGRFSPGEIVRRAASLGMKVIALTDHDSVEGLAEAMAAVETYPSLKVIPGVEINTDVPHGEVHILGYYINQRNRELLGTLRKLRHSREGRALKMIAKLADLGIHIEWKRVEELAAGGSVGRPHIAQALLEKGYVSSIKEAFFRYIGREGPAYVEREKVTPVEAVELVIKAGGLAILAHPADINGLEGLITQLKGVGLVGIEAYYNGYSAPTIKYLVALAQKYQLLVTGGSDYHGLDAGSETPPGGVPVPREAVNQLFALERTRLPIR